jgi:anaerobic C4-dicarboxylate transporter
LHHLFISTAPQQILRSCRLIKVRVKIFKRNHYLSVSFVLKTKWFAMNPTEIFAFSIYFCLIGILGMLMVLETILAPLSFAKLVRVATGIDFNKLSERDTATRKGFKAFVSFTGSAWLGSNGFTFVLAWMAFHNSNALAWWALWFWPVMFGWHAIIYKRGTALWYFQILWIVLSVSALIVTKDVAFG